MSAIVAQNLYKNFHYQHQKTIKELFQAVVRRHKTVEFVQALKNISFEIKKGETVGIIGRNGAGKSTLLSLIAGVSEATKGSLNVNGTVAPLISLGAGFHPDLTGRENIMLNGVILGLDEEYIRTNIEKIISFSEISQKFIDSPIKYYSSGMYMRLGFSVAIHTNPSILLIDEILAVGDLSFQRKCFQKLDEFKKNETTIIFVSHDMKKVEEFCDRILYLEKGLLKADGKPNTIVDLYKKDTLS